MNILGAVRLETLTGLPEATVTYTKHPSLRPYQLAFQGIWYVQNRCDDGVWVYRAVSDMPGSCGTDPAVKAE